ncbi:MAG TPA: HAD-IIIA family hydrolase [Bacteroidia bacterium]|nr:HAD-IIIA family hydrolase [Bacteroidia bacterium]
MTNFKQRLKQIKCFVFDVDGVLTNGALVITTDGEFLRTMNIKDGYALQLAVKKGFKVAVISGGRSEGVPKRMNRLGITDVFMGVEDKVKTFESFIAKYHLNCDEIIYMGDDMPDIKVMQKCGIATCPNDAVSQVKKISAYISPCNGGEGCVRDIIEQTMRLHGKWE